MTLAAVFIALAGAFVPGFARAEALTIPGTLEAMPADVTVQLTFEGPVYANRQGMTLHTTRIDSEPGKSNCTDSKSLKAFHDGTLFHYYLPYPYEGVERRTCIQKWPPFQPSADAKPVGKWSIIDRPDGLKQWAYAGRPTYTSIVDRRPGEVSETAGTRRPLPGQVAMPVGLKYIKTVLGLTLADRFGKTLYSYADDKDGKPACNADCARKWPPVLAAAGAAGAHDAWSIVKRDDGQRQWAYQGRPLYTYVGDEGPAYVEGAKVSNWSAVVVKPLPTPPEGIHVVETPRGPVYVDRNGMSIYWLTCHEENEERLSCAREGDGAGILHGLCGGRDKCADNFRLIKVTDDTRKDDMLWTVRSVDLKNPLRTLDDPSLGTKVWEYNRRLVFTYGGDAEPGEIFGHGVRLQIVADVVYLPAYGAPDQ